jgi:polyhydroxyalkanoate synthesis regulator phasin
MAGLAAVGAIAIAAVGIGGAAAQTPSDDTDTSTLREQYRDALAGQLGISVDELTNAQTAARDKVIDDAVTAGKLTREQAEKLKSEDLGQRWGHGFGLSAKVRNAVISVFQTAADVVGLPADQLRERLANGESLADVAKSQNIDEATLKSDLVTALTDQINQAVTDGKLSQDRANALLDRLDEVVGRATHADRPFEGRFRSGPSLRHFGMQN